MPPSIASASSGLTIAAADSAPRRPISSCDGDRPQNLIRMRRGRQPPHRLDDDGAADAVVPALGEVVVGAVEDREGRVGHDRIARRDAHRRDFRFGRRAHVEEQAVARIDARAFVGRHHVDVADAGDGAHGALRADDDPALIDERLVQPPAQHLHRQKPARRDAAHHAAELVHVRVDHHARTLRALRRDDRPQAVERQRARERLHRVDHDLADRLFESGRAGRVRNLLQQRDDAVLGPCGRNRARKRRQSGGDDDECVVSWSASL